MRHGQGLRKLGRTTSHRLAMLRNMTVSLLRHEEITTTLPKAKELRRVVEPMITLGKKPSLANRRLAFDRLRDRDIVSKLFDDLGPRYAKRNGGYLRILKTGFRKGDILTSYDGRTDLPRETDILFHALSERKAGDTVEVDLLREGKKMKLTLPIQP